MHFDKNVLSLYMHDVRDGLVKFNFNNKYIFTLYSFIQTADGNSAHFLSKEVTRTNNARSLCKRISSLCLRKFSKWLNKGWIRNTELVLKDARRAENIHRYKVARLRGTFKRSKSSCVSPSDFEVPRALIEKYERVRVFLDIMCVSNLLFLYTVSKRIIFRTATLLLSCTK